MIKTVGFGGMRFVGKVLAKLVALPMLLMLSILSVIFEECGSIFHMAGSLAAKLVAICIILAVFTQQWLAAILFSALLGIWAIMLFISGFVMMMIEDGIVFFMALLFG